MTLPRFPYRIGDVVAGHDCMNAPFTGTVTKLVGPYSVILDDHVFTPISLIDTPPTNVTLCSVCDAPQFETVHGVTCVNGHGGADPKPEAADVFG